MRILKTIILLNTAILLFAFSGCGNNYNKKIVGKNIKLEDIREFYYTYSATTNPPKFQRYYFHNKDGKYLFTYEKREGENVFLTEDDITSTGTIELTTEEWATFFELINGGTVTKRSDEPKNDGADTSIYLYWNGDKEIYQEFCFESSEKKLEFKNFCVQLKEKEVNN